MDRIIEFLVALLLLVCGIVVFTGHISIMHSYHIENVTDVKGYGRVMGIGLMIMSVGPGACGLISLLKLSLSPGFFSVILMVPILIGIAFAVKAQLKYNGGIF